MGLHPTENLLRWHSNLFFRVVFLLPLQEIIQSLHFKFDSSFTAWMAEIRSKCIYLNARFHLPAGHWWRLKDDSRVWCLHYCYCLNPWLWITMLKYFSFTREPIKENFQLLSPLPVIQRTQFNSLSNRIKEWKKTSAMKQVLKCIWRPRTQSGSTLLIGSQTFPRLLATWEWNPTCQSYLWRVQTHVDVALLHLIL